MHSDSHRDMMQRQQRWIISSAHLPTSSMQLNVACDLYHADITIHQQPTQLRVISSHCNAAAAAYATREAGFC
jgi:hypothetical protein